MAHAICSIPNTCTYTFGGSGARRVCTPAAAAAADKEEVEEEEEEAVLLSLLVDVFLFRNLMMAVLRLLVCMCVDDVKCVT